MYNEPKSSVWSLTNEPKPKSPPFMSGLVAKGASALALAVPDLPLPDARTSSNKDFLTSSDRSVKKFHLFSPDSFSTPFFSDVIKSAETNNFIQRREKKEENLEHLILETSFAPPDLLNLLQSPTDSGLSGIGAR
ncbi:hypothetical protein CDAR_538901 [Caerostris darwini]|uniref:Uncharacterized protein n=1 Tax=Caerostris darwini TaxID=1538125 RepID=A0AAV4T1Q7_9ARAC|nr:hypothetical protein CDAR_538901 [Caerostris darwini]